MMVAHEHAALMALYAQDAMETDKPWERWQILITRSGGWVNLTASPEWSPVSSYRRKPRTIRIGKYDVPEPVREAPPKGRTYWAAQISEYGFKNVFTWHGCWDDKNRLQRGLIHLTPEAADLHGRALVSLTEVKP